MLSWFSPSALYLLSREPSSLFWIRTDYPFFIVRSPLNKSLLLMLELSFFYAIFFFLSANLVFNEVFYDKASSIKTFLVSKNVSLFAWIFSTSFTYWGSSLSSSCMVPCSFSALSFFFYLMCSCIFCSFILSCFNSSSVLRPFDYLAFAGSGFLLRRLSFSFAAILGLLKSTPVGIWSRTGVPKSFSLPILAFPSVSSFISRSISGLTRVFYILSVKNIHFSSFIPE